MSWGTVLNGPGRVWPSRIVSDLTIGIPASVSVASCTVKSVIICSGTRPVLRFAARAGPAPGRGAPGAAVGPEGAAAVRGAERWSFFAMRPVDFSGGDY